nr:hypothetical protein [Morganella morganii]
MQIYRLYDWSGLTPVNLVVTGTLISSSENNAVNQLISQSITPVSLSAANGWSVHRRKNTTFCISHSS